MPDASTCWQVGKLILLLSSPVVPTGDHKVALAETTRKRMRDSVLDWKALCIFRVKNPQLFLSL